MRKKEEKASDFVENGRKERNNRLREIQSQGEFKGSGKKHQT